MAKDKLFLGSGGGGGGKGGGSADFTNTPDNLRSTDTFEGLMGVCVGPIKGPVDGLKSVSIDGTPILNSTGEENFPGFLAMFANGDPAMFPQSPELRLGAAAAPINVGVSLSNLNTGPGTTTPGPWTSRTVPNVGPDYLDLRFIVQQLFLQSEEGVYDATATLEIEMKPSTSTTWINPLTNTTGEVTVQPAGGTGGGGGLPWGGGGGWGGGGFQGASGEGGGGGVSAGGNLKITHKTTQPAVVELRLWVPNTGNYENVSWDIRVRLLEREAYTNDKDTEQRQISWESISAVYNDVIGEEEDWRGLSWLQLYGKASDNLRGVPEVDIVAETKIVQVPPISFFDPQTREYAAGIWDGTWASAYTNDPAWVINNALSDDLSGLAKFAPGAHLNKWDALEASKWFSEQVSDGDVGTHPRYSLNVVHNQSMKAEEFIRYLAGAVGAMAWDTGSGEWRMKVDKPETPVDIFTLENIEGEFSYAHTDVDTRYNDYRGTFLNEEFDFREETIGVVDSVSVANIGYKPTTIALIGCTNRQEALRRLMIRLRSSVNETKIVNFTTNRRADHLLPLDVILVADADLGDADHHTTGRVVSMNPARTEVTVRDPIRLEVGVAYTLRFAKMNASYEPDTVDAPASDLWKNATVVDTRTIMNTSGQRGDVTTLYLNTALPADASEYLVVALEATGLTTLPKQYRILSLNKDDDSERVTVSAAEIDTGKWAAADNVDAQDSVFVDLSKSVEKPLMPVSGPLLSVITNAITQGTAHSIVGNFQRPPGPNVDGYKITYTLNGGTERVLSERTRNTSFDLVNPTFGDYVFFIRAANRRGVLSEPLTGNITVTQAVLTAADLLYLSGQTIEELQPAEAGSDVTGSNVASGIFGQGDLATQDAVDWASQIFGVGMPEDGATRNVARGDWATATAYAIGDIFQFNNSSYIVHTAHTSSGVVPDLTKIYTLAQAGIMVDIKFIRSNTAPSTPTGSSPVGWTDAVPSGSETLWVSRVNKLADGTPIGAWSTPSQLSGFTYRGTYNNAVAYLVNQTVSYNGGTYIALLNTTGNPPSGTASANTQWEVLSAPAPAGTNVAVVLLYKRAVSTPAVPTGTTTYTFATGVLSAPGGGWTQTIPGGTDPLYVTTASATGTGATDTIATGEWASPTVLVSNGATGSAGFSAATVFLYQRATSAPAVPSVTTTYTFATGDLASENNGWTQTIPGGSAPLYVTQATASSTGATDTIATGEWSAPVVLATSGGLRDIKFIRSLATPATPTGDNPASWSDTIPAGTDTLWMTVGTKNAAGVLQGTWSTPRRLTTRVFRGAYSAGTTYYLYDEVSYNGGTYMALQDNFSGQTPSGTTSATAYWDVVAAPGATGAPGTPPSAFSATINLTSGAAVNMYTAALAAGYTGVTDSTITFKVPNGVTIRGINGGIGLDTGTWPVGYTHALTLVVESGGIVDGGGGAGGHGSDSTLGGKGNAGGDAIYVRINMTGGITINSGGTVRSGGGGGGGGGAHSELVGPPGEEETIVVAGGGGGGGAPNGPAGTGGSGASNGSVGTTGGGGAGGAGQDGGPDDGGAGGAGATFNGTGTTGSTATGSGGTNFGGGAGGAPGYAVRKNGKTVTVTNNGTMTGMAD